MPALKRLKEFLDKNKVKYSVKGHTEVYTAQEVAAVQHVPGQQLVKTVMVKVGDKFVMTALPASYEIEFAKLKKILGEKDVRLAKEEEFKDLFPDCDIGAMPPFGNLYNIPTYIDKSLTEDEEIVFEAGTHKDSVRLKFEDYEKLVQPKIAEFGIHGY